MGVLHDFLLEWKRRRRRISNAARCKLWVGQAVLGIASTALCLECRSLVAGLYFWPDAPMSDNDDFEASASGPEEQRPAAPKAKGKSKSKAKSEASGGKARGDADRTCFHARCNEKKASNSRFCRPHHRLAEAMKYQADSKGESSTYQQVFSEPQTAADTLDDFERSTPSGRFRKKLIDWVDFRTRYGVRTSFTHREAEEQMNKTDFVRRLGLNLLASRRSAATCVNRCVSSHLKACPGSPRVWSRHIRKLIPN